MKSGRIACSDNHPYRLPVLCVITSLNSEQFVARFRCSTPVQYHGLRSTNTGEGQQFNCKDITTATEGIIGCHCASRYKTGCCERSAVKIHSGTQNDRAVV